MNLPSSNERVHYLHYPQTGRPPFIFFHIPKCAGTSIKHSLGIRENVVSVNHDRSLTWRWGVYFRFRWDQLDDFDAVYSFTVVRNPWDRAVSAWQGKFRHRFPTLAAYLSHPFLADETLLALDDEAFARQAAYEWHSMPQVDYLQNGRGIAVRDIFRYENLENDWQIIQEKTAVQATLTHMNQSAKQDYRSYYDALTYDLVVDRYGKDIDSFGYSF